MNTIEKEIERPSVECECNKLVQVIWMNCLDGSPHDDLAERVEHVTGPMTNMTLLLFYGLVCAQDAIACAENDDANKITGLDKLRLIVATHLIDRGYTPKL
jgi:hypothetical protein